MQQEGQAILVAVFTLVFLCTILIVLFIVFQKHKNKLLLKQNEAEKQFDREIAKTQIEIREETFRNISWELHDNIGQLLTPAKIQLQNSSDNQEVIITLDKGLKELRTLSKAINPEALKNITLATAIKQEIERLNRLQYLQASLHIEGEERSIDHEVEVVFFRMIQEFFSNTIKHAKATHLKVTIIFNGEQLNVFAEDNGTGFNKNRPENKGIGLTNIKKRAQLVNAKVSINSTINEGTQLHISYTLKSRT
ncbi:histidine kinase [Lacinutrix neustonica]|uniref:histidine kinase n=1 Tax=Lacinutrix neustonica TaxID=2980107 RepID=A0A9E8N0A0_9FLAO|nr:ATP-binding protein [Lacinutrix neustonica]WAC03524.1 histidine kinase [Lacinutrix neustonica]